MSEALNLNLSSISLKTLTTLYSAKSSIGRMLLAELTVLMLEMVEV